MLILFLFIYRSERNKYFLSYCISILVSMKNTNIEDILKDSGLDAIVLCYRHNDNCSCHESYKEAA